MLEINLHLSFGVAAAKQGQGLVEETVLSAVSALPAGTIARPSLPEESTRTKQTLPFCTSFTS